jgi:hypothetical protein
MARRDEAGRQVLSQLTSEQYDPIAAWKRSRVTEQGRAFPETRVLSASEGAVVRQSLLDALDLESDATNRALVDALYAKCRLLPQFQLLDDDAVDVSRMLSEAEILSETVLVLLPLEGAFDSGVRIDRLDLIRFFDDIWYPSTDDLVVIDEERRTLLFVDHHGRVGALRLS